jgi:hypothetical protein
MAGITLGSAEAPINFLRVRKEAAWAAHSVTDSTWFRPRDFDSSGKRGIATNSLGVRGDISAEIVDFRANLAVEQRIADLRLYASRWAKQRRHKGGAGVG